MLLYTESVMLWFLMIFCASLYCIGHVMLFNDFMCFFILHLSCYAFNDFCASLYCICHVMLFNDFLCFFILYWSCYAF